MPLTTAPEWQQLALYGNGAGAALILLTNIPHVGRVEGRTLMLVPAMPVDNA